MATFGTLLEKIRLYEHYEWRADKMHTKAGTNDGSIPALLYGSQEAHAFTIASQLSSNASSTWSEISNLEGVDLLTLVCQTETGHALDSEYLLKVQGQYALDMDLSSELVNNLQITDVANYKKAQIKKGKRVNKNKKMSTSRIFISHSSLDVNIVEELIDLLEKIGLEKEQIFCTSVSGYGLPLGEKNFLTALRNELSQNPLVLFTLSENFNDSPICSCELGAAWAWDLNCIPILIPPFSFKDLNDVLKFANGMEINSSGKLNELKKAIEKEFELESIDYEKWETARDRFLKRVNSIIS